MGGRSGDPYQLDGGFVLGRDKGCVCVVFAPKLYYFI